MNKYEYIVEWEVIRINSSLINLTFIIDIISIYFLRLVRLVSGRVIIFSRSYMIKEKFYSRFLILLFIFIMSIYLLILRPNLIRLLLGWDGLGVTSYLLVIFYQSNKSYNAGILTALSNRLGDVGLLISIRLIVNFGSWNYIYMNSTNITFSKIFLFILIISACTKSAQIPFSSWLPAAIAAPTPVSALVHSSTLVTAGVYLLIRINIIIVEINLTKILLIVGIITIIIAGFRAIKEIDIKKIIALSTLSQLGIIIIILGIGNPILSFFHLISHAFFKAILFICAGIIIHNMKDYQDIRKIGISYQNINFSISIIMIANISLCGLPFIRGFYSKDLIIEILIIKGRNILIFMLIIIGTILTVLYSCRLNTLVSINYIKMESYYFISENYFYMLLGITLLLPLSIIGGIIIRWNLISSSKIIFLPFWIKTFIFLLIIFSIYVYLFIIEFIKISKSNIIMWFFRTMWFLPVSINYSLNNYFLSKSIFMSKIIENSWSENIIFKYISNYTNQNHFNKYLDFLSYIYLFQIIEIFTLFIIVYFILINN